MIRNFIFDLYGTLADIHTNEKSAYLWNKMAAFYTSLGANYDGKELRKEYLRLCALEVEKTRAQVGGAYPEPEIRHVFRELMTKKGVTPTSEMVDYLAMTFRILSRKYLRLFPYVTEILAGIHEKGGRVFLLSNAQHAFTMPELIELGLLPYFDGVLISSEYELCKPDVRFMDACMKKYRLNPKECIMVGNDPTSDIKIANDYGIPSVYILTDEWAEKKRIAAGNPLSYQATYEILDGDYAKVKALLLNLAENR